MKWNYFQKTNESKRMSSVLLRRVQFSYAIAFSDCVAAGG
jgi:hypothetical protein